MLIAKVVNNEVVSIADYRAMFPSVIFPPGEPSDAWLLANSCMRVNVFKPHNQLSQTLEPVTPYIENDWVYTVAVRELSAEEVDSSKKSAMANIRAQRNKLLAETDWRYRRDQTTTADWDSYCKALRDIPAQITASGEDPRTWNSWPHSPDYVPLQNMLNV